MMDFWVFLFNKSIFGYFCIDFCELFETFINLSEILISFYKFLDLFINFYGIFLVLMNFGQFFKITDISDGFIL